MAAVLPAVYLFVANVQIALGAGWSKDTLGSSTGLPVASMRAIVENIAKWLLAIFGFVAVVGFVISGVIYLTSAGDEDRQKTAKRAMIYSITGVIVGLAGLVVIYAADALLRGTSF